MSISTAAVSRAQALIKAARQIVITNHISPDADAMGAALGLQHFLRQLGKKSQVIVPNAYAQVLHFLPGDEGVMVFEEQRPEATALLEKAELVFHLDYNAYGRSGPMEEVLRDSKAHRILIDHHQQPEEWPDVLYSDIAMSSTCEMIYHFAEAMSWLPVLNKDIATCLYTGIMTDTGNFRFSSTSPTTHRVVAALLEAGAVPHEIASAIYDSNTRDRLKLLSCALENMEVYPAIGAVIIPLSWDELEAHNYQRGDTEGFVNYGLSLVGIHFSIFLTEMDDKVKISFRSKGDFDVNQFARTYFEGGGHKNAAGGISHLSLGETLLKLRGILGVGGLSTTKRS